MQRHPEVFDAGRIRGLGECPFMGGANQLWRNVLLALAVEDSRAYPYGRVHLSVVQHPRNPDLGNTMADFRSLLKDESRFSHFTSNMLVQAAEQTGEPSLLQWAAWYRGLYDCPRS